MLLRYFCCFFLLLTSCKTAVNFNSQSISAFEEDLPIEFWISKKENTGKWAFFFMEDPDTNDAVQQMVINQLHKYNYKVIIPLPQGYDLLSRQTLDSRENRVNSALQLYMHMKNKGSLDSSSQILLIGLKEQAYTLAQLSNAISGSVFISINAGPHSYLYEIMNLKNPMDSALQQSLEFQDLYWHENMELHKMPEKMAELNPNQIIMGKNTNRDWLSYYYYQTSGDFLQPDLKGYLLISENYPFINENSKLYLKALLAAAPSKEIKTVHMPGTGNYEKEEEREILKSQIGALLNTIH